MRDLYLRTVTNTEKTCITYGSFRLQVIVFAVSPRLFAHDNMESFSIFEVQFCLTPAQGT